MNAIRCFVLTGPASNPLRLESVRRQCEAVGLKYEIVTGFGASDPVIARRYSRWRNLIFNKRSLSQSEVAAYLGHKRIWEKIISEGLQTALVLEDDFQFAAPETAAHDLSIAFALAAKWDVVKLFDFKQLDPKVRFTFKGLNFAVHERPNSGMVGYFASARFCSQLLASPHVFRPVDEELRYWFKHRVTICSIVPSIITDASAELGGSVIDPDRQAVKRKRNYLRSVWGNFITLYINIRCRIWCSSVIGSQKQLSR